MIIGFGGYVALPAYLAAGGGCSGGARGAGAGARGERQGGYREQGRRAARGPGAGRGRPGLGLLASAEVVGIPVRAADHHPRSRRVCAPRRARISGCPPTDRYCWSSAARRARVRSTRRCRRGRAAARRGRDLGAARARAEEHASRSPNPAVTPRVCRGAVPVADGPGLCRGRRGDLPVRRDDGRGGVGGGPARLLRAAAARQRRAGTQRADRWSRRGVAESSPTRN